MSQFGSRAVRAAEDIPESNEHASTNHSERSPLLSTDLTSSTSTPTNEFLTTGPFSLGIFGLQVVDRRFRWVLLQIALVGVVLGVGSSVAQGPSVRLLEATICRQYYGSAAYDGSDSALSYTFEHDESRCKINIVQTRLATLRGTITIVDCIPGLLLAPFFGRMADRRGRRSVMLLNAIGLSLNFCSFMLIASLLFVLGGGAQTMLALMLTTIADIVPDSKRSTTFFFLLSTTIGSQFIASAMNSVIMLTFSSLYMPFVLVLPLSLALFVAIGSLPDTRSFEDQQDVSGAENLNQEHCQERSWAQKLKGSNVASSIVLLGHMLRGTRYHYAVSFAVIADIVNCFGVQLVEVSMQYISRRYGWTMAQSSVVYSIKSGIAILMYLFILPLVSDLVRRRMSYKNAPMATDVWMARGSLLMLLFGALAISLAPTGGVALGCVVLYSMGAGLSISLKSVATYYVDKSQLGTLYTGLASAEMLGAMLGGPSLALLLAAGINSHGQWAIALPFWVSTIIYAIATVLIWNLPVKEKIGEQ